MTTQRPQSRTAGEFKNFQEVIDEAEANTKNNWEDNFIGDMSDKYKQYGDKIYISEKQIEILQRIADKDLELAPPPPEKPAPHPLEDGKDPF